MTAATYTFTLSAAQSSAASMVVAMRAKTGSSIPGNASRWQGGVMPQATLNWAAGATTATTTVNTAPNSTVDGNAEYEWYKVSSTPSDLTLDLSALPTVTITDDDSAGGGDTVVYGPQTTTDSGYVQTGSATHRISGKLADVTTYSLWIVSNATGSEAVRWDYTGFNGWRLVEVTGGSDTIILTGSVNPSANPDFTFQQTGGRLTMTSSSQGTLVIDRAATSKAGTYARAQITSPGQPITITRLASGA